MAFAPGYAAMSLGDEVELGAVGHGLMCVCVREGVTKQDLQV